MTVLVLARPRARLGEALALLRPAPLVLLVEPDHGPPHEWESARRGLLGRSERGGRHQHALDASLRAVAEEACRTLGAEAEAAGFEVLRAAPLDPGPPALAAATEGIEPSLLVVCGWPGPAPPHVRHLAERLGVPVLDAPEPHGRR